MFDLRFVSLLVGRIERFVLVAAEERFEAGVQHIEVVKDATDAVVRLRAVRRDRQRAGAFERRVVARVRRAVRDGDIRVVLGIRNHDGCADHGVGSVGVGIRHRGRRAHVDVFEERFRCHGQRAAGVDVRFLSDLDVRVDVADADADARAGRDEVGVLADLVRDARRRLFLRICGGRFRGQIVNVVERISRQEFDQELPVEERVCRFFIRERRLGGGFRFISHRRRSERFVADRDAIDRRVTLCRERRVLRALQRAEDLDRRVAVNDIHADGRRADRARIRRDGRDRLEFVFRVRVRRDAAVRAFDLGIVRDRYVAVIAAGEHRDGCIHLRRRAAA